MEKKLEREQKKKRGWKEIEDFLLVREGKSAPVAYYLFLECQKQKKGYTKMTKFFWGIE